MTGTQTRTTPAAGWLSIVVPVLDEASGVVAALRALAPLRECGHEVIVVDGGSRDGTPALAAPWADRVLSSERGRARQMNTGAELAGGEVLLFLHADTLLPAGAAAAVRAAVATGTAWGRFDVRIKRVDFASTITESVYRRMESERKRVANELRSEGGADGEKIRADAEKQREVILAEAYRDAQKVKGEGDAKASALYADAFGRDPQFAQFYRSLEAYRATFRSKNDVMVMDPSSDFFKAMRGGAAPAAAAAKGR